MTCFRMGEELDRPPVRLPLMSGQPDFSEPAQTELFFHNPARQPRYGIASFEIQTDWFNGLNRPGCHANSVRRVLGACRERHFIKSTQCVVRGGDVAGTGLGWFGNEACAALGAPNGFSIRNAQRRLERNPTIGVWTTIRHGHSALPLHCGARGSSSRVLDGIAESYHRAAKMGIRK